MKHKLQLVLLSILIISIPCFSQLTNRNSIENIVCSFKGEYVEIRYDLYTQSNNDKFYVQLQLTNNEKTIDTESRLSGDVNKIINKGDKLIIWYPKPGDYKVGDGINIQIKASPKYELQTGQYLARSMIYPGLGDYKIRQKKKYWLVGAMGYGFLAGGIAMNMAASNTYHSYLNSTSPGLYDRAVLQRNISYGLFIGAGAVWTFDLTGILYKSHKVKRTIQPIDNKYYFESPVRNDVLVKNKLVYLNNTATTFPPQLSLISYSFIDENGDNCINANEADKIVFEVANTGKGDAVNLTVNCKHLGSSGIDYKATNKVDVINSGKSKVIEIPIKGLMSITNGVAIFSIKLDEPEGFGLDEFKIEVKTIEFANPLIKVADYNVVSSDNNSLTLEKKKPFSLKIFIQNIGKGDASNVSVVLNIPTGVLCLSSNENISYIADKSFEKIKSGELKEITYLLAVREDYNSTQIPIKINLYEYYGKYSQNKEINLQLSQNLSQHKLVVQSNSTIDTTVINEFSLTSDVDKNIPLTGIKDEDKFALIIGNENYTSYQKGISTEMNVQYARNDAATFKEYCIKTFGVPEQNIQLLLDATAGQMTQAIDLLNKIIKTKNGKAKVIVYYAGHGLPDEISKEPYLIPVDVAGGNLTAAIKLSYLYGKLSEFPSQQVSVFIDACFSGGGRESGLMAARSVKIAPKQDFVTGNMVVFTASSGEQSSLPWKEKQHGMFTYFVLKKFQETKGYVSFAELDSYLKEKVSLESLRVNSKEQNPQIIFSLQILEIYKLWKL